jgi:hypothetical protein
VSGSRAPRPSKSQPALATTANWSSSKNVIDTRSTARLSRTSWATAHKLPSPPRARISAAEPNKDGVAIDPLLHRLPTTYRGFTPGSRLRQSNWAPWRSHRMVRSRPTRAHAIKGPDVAHLPRTVRGELVLRQLREQHAFAPVTTPSWPARTRAAARGRQQSSRWPWGISLRKRPRTPAGVERVYAVLGVLLTGLK